MDEQYDQARGVAHVHEMDGGPTTEDLVRAEPIHDTGRPAAYDVGAEIDQIEPAEGVSEVDSAYEAWGGYEPAEWPEPGR